MNNNTAPRVKQSAGTSQANAAVIADRYEGEAQPPTKTPEEHRLEKIEESRKVREHLNRLLAESNARIAAERRRG